MISRLFSLTPPWPLNTPEITRRQKSQFQQAILLAPKEIGPYNDLAIMLFREGRQAEAISYFHKAVELKPLDPNPYFNLAYLYQQSGRDDLALPLYRKVLQIEPNDSATLEQMRGSVDCSRET